MPRQPKPYLRKQTKSWYCSINGQQISLGKDREAAFQKFHELMARKQSLRGSFSSLYELSQAYLDWCEKNRAARTYDNHLRYLKSFIAVVGRRMKIGQLKQHHLTNWLEKHPTWGSCAKNDAISIVQRMISWAIEEGYLDNSPIPKVKKPRRRRREVHYTQQQFDQIIACATVPFDDLLNFMWWTGCRPKEARIIEPRHVHEDLIIFPADESKGETEARMIVMTAQANEIISRRLSAIDEGPLFRNSNGNPWTKDSIKCRLTRISKLVGFRVIAYGLRHSYATNGLLRSVDPVSLSYLMGHKDTRMISQVYSHLSGNIDHLRKQASKLH
ncbi:MAG: tyrosine-type recombinase/integrase [Planctomycetota bacterium]